MLCHVDQTISGEATRRNAEKRFVLPHRHRKTSFKHLVQENPNREERHKHNHEKHERELTAEGSVCREDFDQQSFAVRRCDDDCSIFVVEQSSLHRRTADNGWSNASRDMDPSAMVEEKPTSRN